jgi:hypothetical protein
MWKMRVVVAKLAFYTLSSGVVKVVYFAVIACFAVVFHILAVRHPFKSAMSFSPQSIRDVVAREIRVPRHEFILFKPRWYSSFSPFFLFPFRRQKLKEGSFFEY